MGQSSICTRTMPEQATPRVAVSSIEVQKSDEGGAVAQFFPEDSSVESALEAADEVLGSGYNLVYNLNVVGATKKGAKVTARGFVRSKNLFEPRVINVEEPIRTSGGHVTDRLMEAVGIDPDEVDVGLTDSYSVKVIIEK